MPIFEMCFILPLPNSTCLPRFLEENDVHNSQFCIVLQMLGILTWVCLIALQHVTAQSPGPTVNCPPDEPGPQGWVGPMGPKGVKGEKGERGESASSVFRPPPGMPCHCPEGPKGEKGVEGPLGAPGLYIMPLL